MVKTVINQNTEKPSYPYIGFWKHDKKHVVLFSEKDSGTVLQKGESVQKEVGFYSETWSEDEYKCLTGSITLSNE